MMQQRYRLYRRGKCGHYYIHDGQTGKQNSLGTTDKSQALRLLLARNEAQQQPAVNFQIARAYLMASDPLISQRTLQHVIIAERILLIDDAYQTGYSYQLLRSQLIGVNPAPPAKNMFVLFKAKSRSDVIDVKSFGLTTIMERSRNEVGCALEYEYAHNQNLALTMKNMNTIQFQ